MPEFLTDPIAQFTGLLLDSRECQELVDLASFVRSQLRSRKRTSVLTLPPSVERLAEMAAQVAAHGHILVNVSDPSSDRSVRDDDSDMLGVMEVKILTGKSERTARRICERHGSKVAGRWTIRRSDLERLALR